MSPQAIIGVSEALFIGFVLGMLTCALGCLIAHIVAEQHLRSIK